MRCRAGRGVEFCQCDAANLSGGIDRFDRFVERLHRDRYVAGVCRDAGLAGAHYRVKATETADRGAAAAGLALVAGLVAIVKIGTARALQQVSGGGRLVSKLTRCPGDEGARQQAVIAPDARVGSKIGVANRSAYAKPAVIGVLDPVLRRAPNI